MDRCFLVAKDYKVNAGGIHFSKHVVEHDHTITELVNLSRAFSMLESVRNSVIGRGLRRVGILARIEHCLSALITIPIKKTVVTHTDSFLFMLIISKCESKILYSYDLPWTYYVGGEFNYVKKVLVKRLNSFDKIYCISKGMFDVYEELGLSNIEMTNEFTEKLIKIDDLDFSNKKPLYIGNVRFKRELQALAAIVDTEIIHYGVPVVGMPFSSMGFVTDVDSHLAKSSGGYYGLCVFSFQQEELARSSVPSKILTYNRLGIPVLYYGPRYSEGYKLCNERQLGYASDNLVDIRKRIQG